MREVGDYFPPLCDRVHFFTVSQCGVQAVQQLIKKALQRIIKSAQRIIGCSFHSRTLLTSASSPENIIMSISHPSHHLFDLLPPRKRYRSIKTYRNRSRSLINTQRSLQLNTIMCAILCQSVQHLTLDLHSQHLISPCLGLFSLCCVV